MVALAAVALLVATPADYTVNFPRAIGGWTYYVRGTYKNAVREFGKPSSLKTSSAVTCRARWLRKGLLISFRSPAHPCRAGSLATAEYAAASLTSRKWIVGRGLRVGDSFARMRKLYPFSQQRDMHNKHRWRVTQALAVQPGTMHRRRAYLDALFRNKRIYRIDMGYEFGR